METSCYKNGYKNLESYPRFSINTTLSCAHSYTNTNNTNTDTNTNSFIKPITVSNRFKITLELM